MTLRSIHYVLLSLALLTLSSASLSAIEKNNRNRWNKPTNAGPDKDVPGYLINLGPTGARAILESKSFIVKYIFKDLSLQLQEVRPARKGRHGVSLEQRLY